MIRHAIALLLCLVPLRAAETPMLRPLFDLPTADGDRSWSSPFGGAVVQGGVLRLANDDASRYGGRQMFVPRAVQLPAAGDGALRIQAEFKDLEGASAGTSIRFFLVPGAPLPPRWFDPYAQPHILALYLDLGPQETGVRLFANDGSTRDSPGIQLFAGRVAGRPFPLGFTLLCDARCYALQFTGAQVESLAGSRSGLHRLQPERWTDGAACGLRLVNLAAGGKPTLLISRLSGAFDAAGIPGAAPPAAGRREALETRATVFPRIARAIGGQRQVQPIFGGNANGSGKAGTNELVRELRLTTTRIHMWPDVYGAPRDMRAPTSPEFVAQFGDNGGYMKALPKDEVAAAWDRWFALDFDRFLVPSISEGVKRPASGGMEAQLAIQKEWDCTGNIVFFANNKMDAHAVRHPEDVCRYFDAYLRAVETYAPWLSTTFLQMTNEPNYGWYVSTYPDEKAAVAGWLGLYNVLDAHLRRTHPATRLLGPCLASSAFFSWGGWQTWTVPIIAGAALDVEYYNYHNYDTAAVSHLAWMGMLQAQAEKLGRRRPRAVVTEMNDGVDTGQAGAKFEWWSEQLFSALENPDKFHIIEYFLVAWMQGPPGRPGGAGNLVAWDGKAAEPTDTYWLYRTLARTRGEYRAVDWQGLQDVKIIACTPDPGTLVVSLLNNTGREVTVHLESGLSSTAAVRSLRRLEARRQGGYILHADEEVPAATGMAVAMRPTSVQSWVWSVDPSELAAAATVERGEWFADAVAQRFRGQLAFGIAMPRIPDERETVALRLAVATDDALATRGARLTINGHEESVSWGEAPRERENAMRSTWLVEVPIPRAWLARANAITVAAEDTELRLMYSSLAITRHQDAAMAASVETRALAQRRGSLGVKAPALGAILAGERRTLAVEVENRGAADLACAVSIAAPAWLSATVPSGRDAVVRAGASASIAIEVEARDAGTIRTAPIEVTIAPRAGEARTVAIPATTYPHRAAARIAAPPAIDGDLGEWTPDRVVTCVHEGRTARLRFRWDAASLYVAAEVATGRPVRKPETKGHFWAGDAIELFIDVGNKKGRIYDATDGQFFFCPYEGEADAPGAGRCLRVRKGDVAAHAGVQVDGPWRVARAVRPDGYVIEGAIPWSCLAPGYVPSSGARVGMDAAVSGFPSLFGTENKPFNEPARWGILVLEP